MGICGNPPHALAFSNIAFWISGAIVTNMRFCSRIFVALLALALILSGTIQLSYASAAMSPANMSRMIDAQGDGCDDCGSVKAAPCSISAQCNAFYAVLPDSLIARGYFRTDHYQRVVVPLSDYATRPDPYPPRF